MGWDDDVSMEGQYYVDTIIQLFMDGGLRRLPTREEIIESIASVVPEDIEEYVLNGGYAKTK